MPTPVLVDSKAISRTGGDEAGTDGGGGATVHGQAGGALPGGPRYECEWRDGKLHDRGVLTLPDGERIEGEFRYVTGCA